MRLGRFQRAAAWGGVPVLAVVFVLTVLAWRDYQDTPVAKRVATRALTEFPPPPPAAIEPGTRIEPPRRPRTVTPLQQPSTTAQTIALTASRGDCWLEVRRSGRTLYAGILAEGQTRRFTGDTLELTLGAPSNVDALLNGRPVRNLPRASSNAIVTDGVLRAEPIA